jgi:hypothetical protein
MRARNAVSSRAYDNDAFEDGDPERLRPLEDRLRRLNWPQPPPGLRERSLEEFRRKLSQSGSGANGAPDADGAEARDAGSAHESN